jgi:cyclophilin family peptidyl-prolyl cis-trans isomerase
MGRARVAFRAVRRALLLLLAVAALALAACGGDDNGGGGAGSGQAQQTETTETQAGEDGCKQVEQPQPKKDGGQRRPSEKLDASKTYAVTIATNCGDFGFDIDAKAAPKAGASFVALAKDGFFDDTFFHRIVPGFVIQGGDPTGTGTGGPGYKTVDEPPSSARYTKGVVAMAKAGDEAPGTAGSQFFVVTGDDAGLPPEYAVLGRVTSGLDVVERIGRLGDASEQPTQAVVIEKTTVKAS